MGQLIPATGATAERKLGGSCGNSAPMDLTETNGVKQLILHGWKGLERRTADENLQRILDFPC